MDSDPIVLTVAGSPANRRDLAARLKRLDMAAETCHSAEQLFARAAEITAGCVLLDTFRGARDLAILRRRGHAEEIRLPIVAIAERPRLALACGR